MNNYEKEKRYIFICWLAYAVAYVGRLNYAASIVAIVGDMGVTKSQAGLVSSFFFFAYGVGQIVNGILSKRYNNRVMVFLSLFISACLNVSMPLIGNISVMKYIWLLNGVVQSVLWCTLIKTISIHVSDEKMSTAIVVMSTPVAAGTIVVYGLSALFVKIADWRYTFFVAAVMLLITAFVWFALYGDGRGDVNFTVPSSEENDSEKKSSGISAATVMCLVSFALVGITNGFIKDGINTWGASVFFEEFGISRSFSILLTLLMPMVSLVGATFVARIHKKISSHSLMDLIFYAISAAVCLIILFALKVHSLPLVIVTFVAVACLMSMVNNVVTSVYPLDRRKIMSSGFVSGFLNSFCYVGSTVTSYSLGAISQNHGWNVAFVVIFTVSALAVVLSAAGVITERKEATL